MSNAVCRLSAGLITVFLLLDDPHADLLLTSTSCPILPALCQKNSSQGHFSNLESCVCPLFFFQASANRHLICFLCLLVAIATRVCSWNSALKDQLGNEIALPAHTLLVNLEDKSIGPVLFKAFPSNHGEIKRESYKVKSSYNPSL